MSLSLRRPAYSLELSPVPTNRDFLRDSVPISKFVNEDLYTPLNITNVNFNIERNGPSHRTHFYSYMKDPDKNVLIVRRGQPFRLTIGLSRKFSVRDCITLIFQSRDFSKAPEELVEDSGITSISQKARVVTLKSTFGNKTKVFVPVITASHYTIKSTSKWDAVCDFVGSNSIQVLVQAADDCIVGTWLMSICLEFNGIVSWFHKSRKTLIYVIFNYTCKGDEVYLENNTERIEYVEESTGMIFVGCDHHVMVNFWTFGQFDGVVLDLAILILRKNKLELDVSDRSRASKVAQIIAHAVLQSNTIFKNGNQYREDLWSSASRVIAKYFKKKKPVVYFEEKTMVAVLTSIFRSLGIPARPVTGYNISTSVFSPIRFRPPQKKPKPSASNSKKGSKKPAPAGDRGSTVTPGTSDWVQPVSSEKKSKPVQLKNLFFASENLRVFFTWVEIFTVRKDLDDSYKGWQAISNSGPASVAAIQECHYILDHNTIAFCNQINNTYTYYSFDHAFQSAIPYNEVIGRLGNIIDTKKAGVGVFRFVGIEKNYQSTNDQLIEACKNGFGTEYGRIIEAHVNTPKTVLSKFIGKNLQGLAFHLTPIKNILLGEAMPIHVAATSNQGQEWQASVSVYIYAVSPDGKLVSKVKHAVMKLNKMIEGGSAKLTVPYSEYGSKIQINGIFNVIAVAWATGASEGFHMMDQFFVISIPPPQLLVSRDAIIISLINTLPMPMKNVIVTVYELGETKPNVKLKVPILKPSEKWEDTIDLNLGVLGQYTVIAKTHCNQLISSVIKIFNT